LAIILNAIIPEDPEEPVVEGNVHWSVIGQKSAYFKEGDFDDVEPEGEISNRGTVKEGEGADSGEGEGDEEVAEADVADQPAELEEGTMKLDAEAVEG
jgi:hypothetical protein